MNHLARNSPEPTDVLAEFFADGDFERVVATLTRHPGQPTTTVLRKLLSAYFAAGGSMNVTTRHCVVNGQTAVLVLDWVIRSRTDGAEVVRGTSTDVMCRRADGTWASDHQPRW